MTALRTIDGEIERRLLVNLRIDPDAVQAVLPPGLRPTTVNGWAVGGLCLIRMRVRPAFVSSAVGLTSENLAHRIAVEWDDDDEVRSGVWIPRRASSSWLATIAGGRLFPSVLAHASFAGRESDHQVALDVVDRGRRRVAAIACRRTDAPTGELFDSVTAATAFFARGAIGVSPSRRGDALDRVDLAVDHWSLEPFEVVHAHSSYFDEVLPRGAARAWDSAFLMRGARCEWRGATIPTPGTTMAAAR